MIQKPISTVCIPEGHETVRLEVMRETTKDGDWHNRYVRDATTKEILYYCNREPDYEGKDTKLIFRRGDKDGPVIATADPCPSGCKDKVDIHFTEMNLTLPFEHKHGEGLLCSLSHLLHFKGKKTGDGKGDGVVASYHPTPFEGNRESVKVGELDMTVGRTQDLIVVTAVTAQESRRK